LPNQYGGRENLEAADFCAKRTTLFSAVFLASFQLQKNPLSGQFLPPTWVDLASTNMADATYVDLLQHGSSGSTVPSEQHHVQYVYKSTARTSC